MVRSIAVLDIHPAVLAAGNDVQVLKCRLGAACIDPGGKNEVVVNTE